MESDESLGYHWGSWLGDGIQPLDGLTEGDEANSLELSLLSLAGERAASSPAAGQANGRRVTHKDKLSIKPDGLKVFNMSKHFSIKILHNFLYFTIWDTGGI